MTQSRPIVESAITTRPDLERGCLSDAVDHGADHEHECVHPEDMRADDRKHRVLAVVVIVDDDIAREVHHRDHHTEARERGEHCGPNAGPADELAQRRCRRLRLGVARSDQLGDSLGIRTHELHHHERDECDAARREPGHGECVGLHFLPGEERAEDGRAEDRAEHRAEEHVGDARAHAAPADTCRRRRCGSAARCRSTRRRARSRRSRAASTRCASRAP